MRGMLGLEPGWGITIVRISMGLIFAAHGYQKFAGGLEGASAFFAKVSIPLPGLMAPLIAVLELVGGILLLCLNPCPKCRAAKYSGGACHLDRGHSGQHECNAVSGEMHEWR